MRAFIETFELIKDVVFELIKNAANMVHRNLLNIARFLNISLPFLMYYLGMRAYKESGTFLSVYLIIPIILGIIIIILKKIADKTGVGTQIPTPGKRLTTVNEQEGMVYVDNSRIQELLLFVADIEDYLENRGLL